MAMAIDAAGEHITALGIDVAPPGRQLLRHGDDLLAHDADVAAHRFARGCDRAVANRQVHSTSILGMICGNNGANTMRIRMARIPLASIALIMVVLFFEQKTAYELS